MDVNDQEKIIPRDTPEPDAGRRALVSDWTRKVTEARARWEPAFKRMRSDMLFAAGAQYPGQRLWDEKDQRYIANITLRFIGQRVSTLYARDPRVVARRRPRMLATVWDETAASLQDAIKRSVDPLDFEAKEILADSRFVRDHKRMMDRISKTLENLYAHELREQAQPFKAAIKLALRRTSTCGVGWIKIGFQRIMKASPDGERAIADAQERLSTLERLAADLADKGQSHDTAEAEQMRLLLADLLAQKEIVVREGLAFDWPESDSIIPDTKCRSLRGFLGCQWVAQQYLLTPEQVQEIYKVDVGKACTSYRAADALPGMRGNGTAEDDGVVCVWEIYNRADGLIYTVADGFPDFLAEPASPDVEIEGFWPWRCFAWNEPYLPGDPWPQSDVHLMRDMQRDYNRAREELRQHRVAARPKYVSAPGAFTAEDKEKMGSPLPSHAFMELQALANGTSIDQLVSPLKSVGIDPNLYDPSSAFTDIQRTLGSQAANLGGTSGATATESSIAEASRGDQADFAVDDIDETMTEIARIASQILLLNVSEETVKRIVGPGAVWPKASARDVADELFLEVEAGSSGRPNSAREQQRWSQIMPLLMQLPGVSHEWLARRTLTVADERVELSDAYTDGIPSVQAVNQMAAASIQKKMQGAGSDPAQQGQEGAMNGPRPPSGLGGEGPRMPEARDHFAAEGGGQITN